MLSRARVPVVTAVCLACSLGLAAAAPGAAAAPARSAHTGSASAPRAAASAGFGRGAGRQAVKDLLAAWQITRGHGVTIAVISEGVDASAAGLAGKVTTGPSYGTGAGATAAGTTFASIVAGSGPSAANATGSLGMAPAARILSLQVKPAKGGKSWQADNARAIRYAAGHGAQVIFVLLVGPQDGWSLERAVRYANSKDAVVVGMEYASSSHLTAPVYPDDIPGVIGAGSAVLAGLTTPPARLRTPSNNSILVTAPGNVLTGSGPAGPGYTIYNGLAAAAWLTATVALIKSVYPHLPPGLVARALAVSARDHPPGGYSVRRGFGLIDPVGALRAVGRVRKLGTVAAPGHSAVAASARLAAGPAPAPISAVRHSAARLATSAAAVGAGLVLLAVAALVSRRSRRTRVAHSRHRRSGRLRAG